MTFRVHECYQAWYVALREARGVIPPGLVHFRDVLLGVSAVHEHCSGKTCPPGSRKTFVSVHTDDFGAVQRAGTGARTRPPAEQDRLLAPACRLIWVSAPPSSHGGLGRTQWLQHEIVKRSWCVSFVQIQSFQSPQLVPGDEAGPAPGVAESVSLAALMCSAYQDDIWQVKHSSFVDYTLY